MGSPFFVILYRMNYKNRRAHFIGSVNKMNNLKNKRGFQEQLLIAKSLQKNGVGFFLWPIEPLF